MPLVVRDYGGEGRQRPGKCQSPSGLFQWVAYLNNVARHQARRLDVSANIKAFTRLPAQEVLALAEAELSHSVGSKGRFYRFDCLTPLKLNQFEGALASQQHVESVIFLALQSEKMKLRSSVPGGLYPVLFSIKSRPGKAHIFNRGTRFTVQAIKAQGERREIVLLEQQTDGRAAIPVWR